MSTLFLLIMMSICVAGLFIGALIWGVKNYKSKVSHGPANRIFFDDEFQREIYS